MTFPTIDVLGLVVLSLTMLVVPILGRREHQALREALEHPEGFNRRAVFVASMATQWAIALPLVAWWVLADRGLAPIGLVAKEAPWYPVAAAAVIAIALGFVWQTLRARGHPERLAEAREEAGSLVVLAPRTLEERRLFIGLSITAGVCEELLYRGLLLALFTPEFGTWPAVAASSVVFGFAHVYQGPKGIAKTALAGLVLGAVTVLSGSIYLAMVLHAVVDMTQGRLLEEAVRDAERAEEPSDM